jgi:flagellar assembly protein FliH
LIAAMAHVALRKLGTSSPATIRLNPEDYTVVAHDGERWGGGQVTVVPDPAVARGGCLVESEFGRIDASIERQLEEMSRALLGEGH